MKLFFFLSIVLLSGTAFGKEISFGRGESHNCGLARSLAIKDAIENFSEHELEVSQHQVCKELKEQIDCSFVKDFKTKASGTLKKVLDEKTIIKKESCIVNVKIEIEKAKVFDVEVKAKDFYYAGDVLTFDLVTKEPLYVYIFNIHSYDQAALLYEAKEPLNGKWVIPSNKRIVTYLNTIDNVSQEYLVFFFTKHKVTFKNDLTKKDVEDIIDSVPLFSKKVVFHNFKIIRRSK
jgi:hypothetical protein